MTYKQWLDEWLNHYVKTSNKARTFELYGDTTRLHIIPKLGDYDPQDITPLILQRFISELTLSGNKRTGKGLSPNSVKSVITVIQGSLKTAHSMGLIPAYIADKIKRPKIVEKRVDCFTADEQKLIEKHVLGSNKQKLKGVVLCLYTGLRLGELLALTWDDVDFAAGILSVDKTYRDGYVNGVRCVISDTPKTDTSRRNIPLCKPILKMLKEMKKHSDCANVVSDGGKPIFLRSYQRTFELLLKKLGLPHKGFHALRHTFATRAIECGVDVKSLSELLGHKNATITLNRYTHSLWKHKSEMINKLGKLL